MAKKAIVVIGAPFSGGQGLDGVKQGPDALYKAGLPSILESLDYNVREWKNLDISETHDSVPLKCDDAENRSNYPNTENYSQKNEYTEKEIKNLALCGYACEKIYKAVNEAASTGAFTLTIGGDHAIATGSITGMMGVHPSLAVVWVDAHGDANTPEISPSANYHGMTAAHLMGWFSKSAGKHFHWRENKHINFTLAENRLGYIGLRDIDKGEAILLKSSQTFLGTMTHIDKDGIGIIMEKILKHIDPENNRPLYLSFDIDGCDPKIAPATGTKARRGLTYREAHYICEAMASTNRLVGMDLVEVDPDHPCHYTYNEDRLHSPVYQYKGLESPKERNPGTVKLAVELIASALGKTIL